MIIQALYYIGLIACGMAGALKSIDSSKAMCFFSAVLNSSFGGVTRDLLVLHRVPALLSLAAIPDVLLALIVAFAFRYLYKRSSHHSLMRETCNYLDSIGVATFLYIGFEAAIGRPFMIRIIAACVTASMGGIWALIINRKFPATADAPYYLALLTAALVYAFSMQDIMAQLAVVILTFHATQLSYGSVRARALNVVRGILPQYTEPYLMLFQENVRCLHVKWRRIERIHRHRYTCCNIMAYIRFHKLRFC